MKLRHDVTFHLISRFETELPVLRRRVLDLEAEHGRDPRVRRIRMIIDKLPRILGRHRQGAIREKESLEVLASYLGDLPAAQKVAEAAARLLRAFAIETRGQN